MNAADNDEIGEDDDGREGSKMVKIMLMEVRNEKRIARKRGSMKEISRRIERRYDVYGKGSEKDNGWNGVVDAFYEEVRW